jgi:hypothetical protein
MRVVKRQSQTRILVALIVILVFSVSSVQAFKWKTEIVDGAGNTGWYSSLILNGSGIPSIAYTDADTHTLKYAIWNGTAWAFQTIDGSSQAQQPSLFFNPRLLGYPEVTYYDVTAPGSLKYTYKRTFPLPMIWIAPEIVDTGGVGWGSSLAVGQDGVPKVSYCDFTNNKLKYAVRNSSPWGAPVIIDDACSLNLGIGETSLALDGLGNPHITYWSGGKLKRAYYVLGLGWVKEVIDSFSADVGRDNAITRDKDGWFHVSYIDFTNKKLKYAHHNTVNWVIGIPIDDAQDAKTSVSVDDHGGVHICYRKDGDLKYAYNSSKGFSVWVTQVVDNSSLSVGEFCSLKLDPQGKPRIAYFDRTNGDLKYTQALYEIYQPFIKK